MIKNRFFPTIFLALFSLIVVHTNSIAAPTPAEQAITNWFESLEEAGAPVAKFDAIRVDETTDTATIENPQIDWRLTFEKEGVEINISFSAGQIVFEGFRQEDDGFSAKKYSLSDDAKATIKGKDTDGVPFLVDISMTGFKSEEVFYPKFTPVPEDAQRPVSRFLHYYDLFLKVAIKKSSIENLKIDQTVDGASVLQIEYDGISVKGIQNGQIEESRLKSFRQVFNIPQDAGDVPFDKMETTYGEMLQRGVDFRPIIDAFTGSGKAGDTDYRMVTAETSVSNMKVLVGPATITIDNYTVLGLKVRPGTRSVLAMFDRLALGEKVDDKETLATVLDMFRGFSMDELSISNLQGSGPANVTAKMDKFIISDLSNQGLGKFAIEGIDVNGPGGEKISLGHVSLGKIVFPAIEAIIAMAEQGPPENPFAAAALGPKIGEFEISKLLVDDKKKPAISLGLFQLLQSSFVGAIPTDIKIETQDLNLPVAYIEDPMAQAMLQSLGFNVLKITNKFVLKWDEASEDLTLKNGDVSLDNGAKVSLKAGVAGVPKAMIENPTLFMQAMATLAFKNVNFMIKDAELVPGLIDYFAKMQNMPPEALRDLIVQSLELQAGPLAGTPFLEELKTALSSFLENPKRLTVDLAPKDPVPFTQILGTVSTAPDQMPDLLGAAVSAN